MTTAHRMDEQLRHDPALTYGRLTDRKVLPTAPLDRIQQRMRTTGRRRLAVVNDAGDLIGLLCLKRSRVSFCSDQNVNARATDPQ